MSQIYCSGIVERNPIATVRPHSSGLSQRAGLGRMELPGDRRMCRARLLKAEEALRDAGEFGGDPS